MGPFGCGCQKEKLYWMFECKFSIVGYYDYICEPSLSFWIITFHLIIIIIVASRDSIIKILVITNQVIVKYDVGKPRTVSMHGSQYLSDNLWLFNFVILVYR